MAGNNEEEEEAMGPQDRQSLLLLAAEHGKVLAAEKAVDSERKDPQGNIQELLRCVSAEDTTRNTPLHIACQKGHVDLIWVLLRRGANAALQNASGLSSFHLAEGTPHAAGVQGVFAQELGNRALAGDEPGVVELLHAGVDAKVDYGGALPSEWAKRLGHDALSVLLQDAEQGILPQLRSGEAVLDEDQRGAENPHEEIEEEEDEDDAGAEKVPEVHFTPWDLMAAPIFPEIWPPVATSWRAELSDPNKDIELDFGSGLPVWVALPEDLPASTAAVFLDVINAVFETVALRLQGSSASTPSPPLVLPFSSTSASVAPQAGCCQITLDADPVLGLADSSFRIALLPGQLEGSSSSSSSSSSAPPSIDLSAGSLASLRRAVEVLRQMISLSMLDVRKQTLKLPTCILEDCPSSSGGRCGGAISSSSALADATAATIFMDLLQLPEASVSACFSQLAAWRLSRILVPIPRVSREKQAARLAQLLRRAFHLRKCAEHFSLELIPVLDFQCSAPKQRGGDGVDRGLVALLGHFPSRRVGLRLCGLDEDPRRSKTRKLDMVFAAISDLRSIRNAFSKERFALRLFLPSGDVEFLRSFCGAIRGGWQPQLRFLAPISATLRVILEGPSSEICDMVAAANCLSSEGLPCSWFVNAQPGLPADTSDTSSCTNNTNNTNSTTNTNTNTNNSGTLAESSPVCPPRSTPSLALPTVVWPGESVTQRASNLEDTLHRACVGGALGVIVEVPVWSSPWASPLWNRQPEPFVSSGLPSSTAAAAPSPYLWCSLTAMLAAGLHHSGPTGVNAALSYNPGRLLACHLLGSFVPPATDRTPSLASVVVGLLWDPQNAAAAAALQGASGTPSTASVSGASTPSSTAGGGSKGSSASTGRPPASKDLAPLLDLLSGWWHPPQVKSPDEAVAVVAGLYQNFYKRRQAMREALSGIASTLESGHGPDWARRALGCVEVALTGLEWLLLACQVALQVLRQVISATKNGNAIPGLPANFSILKDSPLKAAVNILPPEKRCDLQNTFLKVVDLSIKQGAPGNSSSLHRTSSGLTGQLGSNGNLVDAEGNCASPNSSVEFEELWSSGLRLGAALELEPWLGFEASEANERP